MSAAPHVHTSLRERYDAECARLGYTPDPAQQRAVALLDDLQQRLLATPPRAGLRALLARKPARELQRGLYLWGGVGRGKTWLMDLFFHHLPLKDKQRIHFYRFMQSVHDELKKHADRADPLELVADRIARKTRVLCFDELFVSDIADAMVLGHLFRALFARGVTLVATSNVPPDDLYRDGLQRARFLPAIESLKEHTTVFHLDDGTDYRLRVLTRATTWLDARAPDTDATLASFFESMVGEPGQANATLVLNHRRVQTRRLADDAVWFNFAALCDGPRGQADYIELGRCFHTVIVSRVPLLTAQHENQARRFISMVDEFYDRSVKLVVSAAAPAAQIYQGERLQFEFQRTVSRLIEMQSHEYLARPHRP